MGKCGRSEFPRRWTRDELELFASVVKQTGLNMMGLEVVLVMVGSDVRVDGRVGEDVHVFMPG